MQAPQCANGCQGCPAPVPTTTPGAVAGLVAPGSAWAPGAGAARAPLLEQTQLVLPVNKCNFFKKHPYFDHSCTTARSCLFSSFVLCVQTFQERDFPCFGDSFLKRESFSLAVLFPAPLSAPIGAETCDLGLPPGSEPAALAASPRTCLQRGEQLSHKRCCA